MKITVKLQNRLNNMLSLRFTYFQPTSRNHSILGFIKFSYCCYNLDMIQIDILTLIQSKQTDRMAMGIKTYKDTKSK